MEQRTLQERKWDKTNCGLFGKNRIKLTGEMQANINNEKEKKSKSQKMLIGIKIETFKKCKFRVIA